MSAEVHAAAGRARRAPAGSRPRARIWISRTALKAACASALLACGLSFGGGYWLGSSGSTRDAQRPFPARQVVRVLPSAPAPIPAEASPAAEPAAEPAIEAPPRRALRIDLEPPGDFGVQLGAFRSLEEASAFVTAHAAALEEVPLHVVTAEIPGRGTWYRVRAGAAKTREDADQLRRSLPAEIGRDALIVPYR